MGLDKSYLPPQTLDQTYENTIARIDSFGLLPEFKNNLNNFTKNLYDFIREEIVIRMESGDERLQESEFTEIVTNVVNSKIALLQSIMPSEITVS